MEEQKSAEGQAQRETQAQVESDYPYRGKRVTIRVDHITDRPGHTYIREIVVHPGAVVMIPVGPDGKIILVRQWRRASGKVLLELPAGTLEEGEEPAVTADRELQEEIGFKAGKLTAMGGFFSAPGFCTEYLHLFLAEDLSESRLDPDANEEIEVETYSLEEAIDLIEQGIIEDAKSVAGLSRYYVQKMRR
ncbi:MAG TPA: NUDIX hydrolase [Chloroflexia bacterium]|nr:NUDIX hydrolase [Chloroflexia bacterium]